MASSNRHWPSMFKSKPTYTTDHQDHHQWQSHRSSPYTSGGCDARTPEPKPRWNPKPEQIRILESIFNSGMVNPPRDEIKKIRTRLQEYGQVGDANVFYWFQNRKSRSKNKTRHLQKSLCRHAVTTSSSSSSDKSSSKSTEFLLNSPNASVNQQPQAYLLLGGGSGAGSHRQHRGEFFPESFSFPVASTNASFKQEFCFPEVSTIINQENHGRNNIDQTLVSSTGLFTDDLMMNHDQYGIPNKNSNRKGPVLEDENIIKTLSHNTPPANSTSIPPPLEVPAVIPPTINDVHQGEEGGTGKLIVFINDVPFEVAVGPFNVKEAFGSDAVLFDSSGQTVVTNDWGVVTNQSLQHGAFYYLARPFTYDHAAGTIDLI